MKLLVLVLAATLVRPPDLPEGVTCDHVRDLVRQHGYLKSLAWALGQGYSAHQIREAKKCLK